MTMSRWGIGPLLMIIALAAGCTRTIYVTEYVRELPDGTVVVTTEEGEPIPQIERTVEFPPDPAITALAHEIAAGSVTIIADASATGVSATVRLLEVTADNADVTFTPTELSARSRNDLPVHIRAITLRVPAGAPIRVSTGHGDITLSGLQKSPRLQLKTSGGAIDVRDCRDVGQIDLETGYGKVTVESVSGGGVTLRSGNGHVTARALALSAAPLSIRTNGGQIDVRDASGISELDLASGYGRIQVADVSSPKRVSFKSGNGNIKVERLSATEAPTLVVQANGGSIDIGTCQGLGGLDLKTGYGAITVAPQPAMRAVAINSGNGNVTVREIDAADDRSTLSVSTNGGSINVAACSGYQSFSLSTGYGRVTVSDCTRIGEAAFRSGNGNVAVTGMRPVASVTAHTNGGKVTVKDLVVSGKMSLKTGYGDVIVEDTTAIVTHLESSSGALKLRRSSLGDLSLSNRNGGLEWDGVKVSQMRAEQ